MSIYNKKIDGILFCGEMPQFGDRDYIIKSIEEGVSSDCIKELIDHSNDEIVSMGLYILSEINPHEFSNINKICISLQNSDIFNFKYYILRNIYSYKNFNKENYIFILKMLLDENEMLHSMALTCFLEFSKYDFEGLCNINFGVNIYSLLQKNICNISKKNELPETIFEMRVIESIELVKMAKSKWKKYQIKSKIKNSKFAGIRKILED